MSSRFDAPVEAIRRVISFRVENVHREAAWNLRVSWLLALIAIMLLPVIPIHAQMTAADVVGTVVDSAGAVVINANVTIVNLGTQEKRQTLSSAAGDYAFSSLQPGSYTLRVEAHGFKAYTLTAYNLVAGSRARLDVKLQPGAAVETIEVQATTIPDLQTDSGTIQDAVPERQVQDLPLNNRNFVGLVQVTAGVNQGLSNSIASGTHPDDRRISGAYSANGQPDTMNNNMIDGLDNNEKEQGFMGIRPGVDSISQVIVMTNDYSAEIGRSTGAVVNVVTKAGTNQFHGAAFEYVRNDIFDARNAFATTGKKPEYRQNNFGGSLGGRIFRDKTFFFTDVEFDRSVSGNTAVSTVPTAAELADPTTVPGFPAGGTINQVALNYFKLYPAANLPGTVNNYQSAFPATQFGTTFDVRVDHHFSANDAFFAEYSYNPVTTIVPGELPASTPSWAGGATVAPGGNMWDFAGPSYGTSQGIHMDYVHLFSANLLLELRAGYTRINISSEPLNFGKNLANKIGIVNGNLPGDNPSSALTMMVFNDGSAALGDGSYMPILDRNNTFQYNGVLTWTRGPQTIKAGGALIRRQLNYYQSSFPEGFFNWANWSDFLQGVYLPNSNSGVPNRGNSAGLQGWRGWESSGFVQDDWRVTKRLTLNLGVRYEVFTPYIEAHNLFSNFDPNTLTVNVATGSHRNVGANTDYGDFSPRFGFAMSLPYDAVLRGGYGISYFPATYQSMIQNPNPPFNFSCGGGSCASYAVFPILPIPTPTSQISTTNPVGGLTYTPSDFKVPYYHQMNLMLQKEWAGNVINVGWVGSLGRRLLFQDNINEPTPSTTPLAPGTPKKPLVYATQLPLVGGIQRNSTIATNNYNSLQATFLRRYRKGLTINLNYTWAHGLGDGVNPSSNNQNGLWTGNPRYDYSNTAVDIRHRIAMSANYELPFGKNLQGFASYVGKGWQLNTISYWQTGSAFGVGNGTNPQINLPNIGSDRPNRYAKYSLVPPSVIAASGVERLGANNTGACFALQAFGTAGNSPEFSDYGPHQRSVNLSMFKYFDLTEKARLQFRAESFNITNTPNFATPSGSYGSPGFGTISSTAGNQNPRQLQLALKVLF